MTDSKAADQSFGEKITACFKDIFKSCYNLDKNDKIDYGEQKSAKLELIQVPTEKVQDTKGDQPEKPHPTSPTAYTGDHTTNSGGHMTEKPEYYPPRKRSIHIRRDVPSTDSFDFSEEDTDYWKQAREVMKTHPPKSSLQRQNSNRRNSKLVRFGSVVRKFDKLEEFLQETAEVDEGEEYYDEGSFDESYEGGYTDEDQYYDQTTDTDHEAYSAEQRASYGHSEQYEPQGYQYQDQYAQQGYEDQDVGYQQENTYAQTRRESSAGNYSREHAQTTTKPYPLSYQGSYKARTEHHVGGVVPSASFRKPLEKDEYKVDIRARVRALEVGQNFQQFTEPMMISTQENLPIELSLPNYEAVKAAHAARIGEPMYTHPGGYKFRIDLWANGKGVGVNTHISITVQSLEGENNDNLKFPAKFSVTLELLNQYSDYNHHVREIACFYHDGSYNTEIGRDFKFIPKEDVYWNAERRTQYVLNDVLRFRVTKITLI